MYPFAPYGRVLLHLHAPRCPMQGVSYCTPMRTPMRRKAAPSACHHWASSPAPPRVAHIACIQQVVQHDGLLVDPEVGILKDSGRGGRVSHGMFVRRTVASDIMNAPVMAIGGRCIVDVLLAKTTSTASC